MQKDYALFLSPFFMFGETIAPLPSSRSKYYSMGFDFIIDGTDLETSIASRTVGLLVLIVLFP